MSTNVYYLTPSTPAAERGPRLSSGLRLRLRLLAFWCRLRVTAGEIADTLRRFGRAGIDADPAFLDQRADLVLAVAPPARRPARIIDFVAARARLRP
jgi:hypothetical protein